MSSSNVMGIQFRLEGIPEVNRILDQLAERHVVRVTRNTNYEIAKYAANQFKSKINIRVRKRSGRLKSSVRFGAITKGSTDFKVYFSGKGFYWRFVDKGSRKNKASPFSQEAINKVLEELPMMLRTTFIKQLEKQIANELAYQARQRR